MIWRARRGVHVVGAQTSPGGDGAGVGVERGVHPNKRVRKAANDDCDDGKKKTVYSERCVIGGIVVQLIL